VGSRLVRADTVRRIEEIPGAEGFYKHRARDAYLAAAEDMITAGMPEDLVVLHLEAMYWTAAECYGGC
jgi:hypothetical protein